MNRLNKLTCLTDFLEHNDAMSRIMNKLKCEQWFYKLCKLTTEHTLNIQLLSIIVYRKITQFVLHSAIRDCTDGD